MEEFGEKHWNRHPNTFRRLGERDEMPHVGAVGLSALTSLCEQSAHQIQACTQAFASVWLCH